MQYALTAAIVLLAVALLAFLISRATDSGSAGASRATDEAGGGTSGDLPDERGGIGRRRNWLVGVDGSVDGKPFHVGRRTVTIGRKPSNFVQIGDQEVSRIHCQIRAPGSGRPELVDMNSSSGTFLNGEKLRPNEPYALEDGDRIEIGSAAFRYELVADYDRNFGVTSAKSAGQKFETSTKIDSGTDWRESIEDEIDRADGDLKQAAENMGVEIDVFLKMMEQAGMNPEDV